MIYSDIKFGKVAQERLMEGVRIMAKAVGSTLGPQGKNVAIGYASTYGEIWNRIVLHDGVTVAKSIYLKDEFANMGAQLLKQAAQKQVQDVGDGTTVSIILASALLEEIQELIAAGVNPMKLRRDIETEITSVISEIEKLATPITSFEQKKQIATISAEDEVLGELVAQVIEDMGVDGLVYPEESKNADTTVEKQEGMQFDKGFVHPYFMTNPDKLEATLEDPYVLVTDKAINTLKPLQKLLEWCANENRKLVMITPHVGQDALGAMLQNKMNGVIPSIVISAPSFGQDQKNKLLDMAIFTGATFITEDAGMKFEDVLPENLGRCDYVTAGKNETIIVGGKGTKEAIEIRIEEIKTALEKEDVEFDREKMKERLAKLTSGVAVIKVGGATEVEMKERLERVKDAVAATKAALRQGIVPGGETVYLHVREAIDQSSVSGQVLYKALYEPFKLLLTNAGLNDGEQFAYWRLSSLENKGIDVNSGEMKNLVESGIVDPTLVPVNALLNASSVAIQIATTGAIVIQELDRSTSDPKTTR